MDAYSYGVSDHSRSVFTLHIINFLNHVGEHKQQSMKEQMIAVQLQSQMTVHAFYIHHLQQKHIQVIKLSYKKKVKSTQKQPSCKKGAAHAKKTTWKKL